MYVDRPRGPAMRRAELSDWDQAVGVLSSECASTQSAAAIAVVLLR